MPNLRPSNRRFVVAAAVVVGVSLMGASRVTREHEEGDHLDPPAETMGLPLFVGWCLPHAVESVTQLGLQPFPEDNARSGVVTSQRPAAGSDVRPGSSIRLHSVPEPACDAPDTEAR